MKKSRWIVLTVGAGLAAAIPIGVASGEKPTGQIQVPTTINDFFQPGTQPDPTGLDLVLERASATRLL